MVQVGIRVDESFLRPARHRVTNDRVGHGLPARIERANFYANRVAGGDLACRWCHDHAGDGRGRELLEREQQERDVHEENSPEKVATDYNRARLCAIVARLLTGRDKGISDAKRC